MGNSYANRQGSLALQVPVICAARVNHDGKAACAGNRIGGVGRVGGHAGDLHHHAPDRRPAKIWKTHKGLEAAVDCVLAQLNAGMAKGPPPNFTHVVSVVTPGQVEEIIPKQIPSGRGELYVVRFTAEDDGTTNMVLFSTLDGLDKRVEHAMDPCLEKSHAPAKVKAQ
jgi:hypothetical protein